MAITTGRTPTRIPAAKLYQRERASLRNNAILLLSDVDARDNPRLADARRTLEGILGTMTLDNGTSIALDNAIAELEAAAAWTVGETAYRLLFKNLGLLYMTAAEQEDALDG